MKLILRIFILAIVQFCIIGLTTGVVPQITRLNVQCDRTGMKVNVEFDNAFNGIIFSKGHFSDPNCRYVRQAGGRNTYEFFISSTRCGTMATDMQNGQNPQGFKNVIIIQNDPEYQEVWDSARKLSCDWVTRLEKTVTFAPFGVDMLGVKELRFPGDTVDCWMDIQRGHGPFAPTVGGVVPIGEKLTVVIYVRDSDGSFDVHVKDCYAYDTPDYRNPNAHAIKLTDERGCPVKEKLVQGFFRTRDVRNSGATIIAYGLVNAFKFPEKMDVYLACNVEVCKGMCPDNTCQPEVAVAGSDDSDSSAGGGTSLGGGGTKTISGGGGAAPAPAPAPTGDDEDKDEDEKPAEDSEGGDGGDAGGDEEEKDEESGGEGGGDGGDAGGDEEEKDEESGGDGGDAGGDEEEKDEESGGNGDAAGGDEEEKDEEESGNGGGGDEEEKTETASANEEDEEKDEESGGNGGDSGGDEEEKDEEESGNGGNGGTDEEEEKDEEEKSENGNGNGGNGGNGGGDEEEEKDEESGNGNGDEEEKDEETGGNGNGNGNGGGDEEEEKDDEESSNGNGNGAAAPTKGGNDEQKKESDEDESGNGNGDDGGDEEDEEEEERKKRRIAANLKSKAKKSATVLKNRPAKKPLAKKATSTSKSLKSKPKSASATKPKSAKVAKPKTIAPKSKKPTLAKIVKKRPATSPIIKKKTDTTAKLVRKPATARRSAVRPSSGKKALLKKPQTKPAGKSSKIIKQKPRTSAARKPQNPTAASAPPPQRVASASSPHATIVQPHRRRMVPRASGPSAIPLEYARRIAALSNAPGIVQDGRHVRTRRSVDISSGDVQNATFAPMIHSIQIISPIEDFDDKELTAWERMMELQGNVEMDVLDEQIHGTTKLAQETQVPSTIPASFSETITKKEITFSTAQSYCFTRIHLITAAVLLASMAIILSMIFYMICSYLYLRKCFVSVNQNQQKSAQESGTLTFVSYT